MLSIEISGVFPLQGTDSRLPYMFTEFSTQNFQPFALTTPGRAYSDLGVSVEQRTFKLSPMSIAEYNITTGGLLSAVKWLVN